MLKSGAKKHTQETISLFSTMMFIFSTRKKKNAKRLRKFPTFYWVFDILLDECSMPSSDAEVDLEHHFGRKISNIFKIVDLFFFLLTSPKISYKILFFHFSLFERVNLAFFPPLNPLIRWRYETTRTFQQGSHKKRRPSDRYEHSSFHSKLYLVWKKENRIKKVVRFAWGFLEKLTFQFATFQ